MNYSLNLSVRLSERHHRANGNHVCFMDSCRTAQLTFGFGGFLGQDVAFERLTAFDGTTRTYTKALFRAAFRFHFRHDTICPLDSSIFNMIAGGNTTLRLDACSHLFDSGIESTVFAPSVCCQANCTKLIFSFSATEP